MAAGTKAVKTTAIITFKANAIHCIIAGLILVFSYFCCVLTSSLFSFANLIFLDFIFKYLLMFLLIFPLTMGLLRFNWRIIFNVKDDCISVFYYFSNRKLYIKCLKLEIHLIFKAFSRSFIFFLPALFAKLFSQKFFYDFFNIRMPVWAGNLGPIFNGLLTFGFVILIFMMLKYYLAPMLIVADENIEIEEAFHMSDIISKKSVIDFIFLCGSFLLWYFASYLIFPLVFTLPYMILSYLYHCRFTVAEYNSDIKILNNRENNFTEGI